MRKSFVMKLGGCCESSLYGSEAPGLSLKIHGKNNKSHSLTIKKNVWRFLNDRCDDMRAYCEVELDNTCGGKKNCTRI